MGARIVSERKAAASRGAKRGVQAALAVLLLAAATCNAQASWPSRPVRVIVPIAAGGVTDVIVRHAAQALAARIGQPLVVDNRTGANGMIGAEACARAAPDGQTLCVLNTGVISVNPVVYERHPFDPARAFIPVVNLYTLTGAVVVPAASPFRTVQDLRAAAVGRTRALNFGTIGPGSYPDMFLGWLNAYWNSEIVGVPYAGGGPVAIALLAGEAHVSAAALGNFIGQIKGGQLRALAVSGSSRSRLVPDVPTYGESGLGDFRGHLWWGLFAPAGLERALVSRLNREFGTLFREPAFVTFLESQAAEPSVGTQEAFAQFVRADAEWTAGLLRSLRAARGAGPAERR